jgi:hypothetical protein
VAKSEGAHMIRTCDGRTPRRQHPAKHLVDCSDRSVLVALLAVDAGQDLDAVLEDFARLDPEIF